MPKIAQQIRVAGRVQGVGFRWTTLQLAQRHHIVGTVANQADGSVEIIAVGAPPDLEAFAASIKAGPSPYARVATYEAHTLYPVPHFTDFRVTG